MSCWLFEQATTINKNAEQMTDGTNIGGPHTNGLSPTQSVPVVRMGVLLANVSYRSSNAKLFAGDATAGGGAC